MSDNPHDKTLTIRVREDGVYEVKTFEGQILIIEKQSNVIHVVNSAILRHECWLKWIKEKP